MGEIDGLRQAYAERRYADAWAEYRRLTAMGPVPAEVHLVGARAADKTGNLYAARRVIDFAMEAEPTGALRAEVLFTRGVLLREVGEYRSAVDNLRAAVVALADEPDLGPVMLGPCHHNLALALRQCREYAEAIHHYREAIGLFRAEGMSEYLRMSLQNLSWACCIVEDAAGARAALDESGPLCASDTAKLRQQVCEAFLWSVAGGDGAREAMAACHGVLSAYGDVPADIRSQACWVAGRIAVQTGQLDAAEELARNAVAFGLQAKEDSRCLLDASDLLRAVKEARVSA